MSITHAIGGYQVTDEVLRAVQEASASTGVDFAFMMSQAANESSFDAEAKARTSSATGLYQFIDSTWLTMVKEHGGQHGLGKYQHLIETDSRGRYVVNDPVIRREILDLRNDPRLNAVMAGEFAASNKRHLERSVGGTIGPTDMYMAHFLGPSGATTFLNALRRSPDAPAADFFPAAAQANRAVFYNASGQARSLQDVYNWMDRRVDRGMQLADGLPSAPPARSGPAAFLANARPTGDLFMATEALEARAAGAGTGAGQDHSSLSLWTVLTLAALPVPGEDGAALQAAAAGGATAQGGGRIPLPTGFFRG